MVGSIVQINNVSDRYFQYRTGTTVAVDVPTDINFPSLSTCWHMIDILNLSAVNDDYGVKLERWNQNGFSWNDFYLRTNHFKVHDWFKFTPQVDEIVKSCRIRFPRKYVTTPLNHSDCMKYFNIKKYLWSEYMCYQFDPLILDVIEVHEYTMSPSFNGLIYSLSFDTKYFGAAKHISQAVHIPTSSFMLDSVLSKSRETQFDGYPSSEISYREFNRIKMGPPYQPKCNPNNDQYGTEKEMQFHEINRQAMLKYGIITPFVRFYNSSSDLFVPSYLDFRNETFVRILNNLLDRVPQPEAVCKFKFLVTWIIPYSDSKEFFASIFWPASETLLIVYVPDQDLIDYIVYVCSCIGIWFGLSFYSTYDGILHLQNFIRRKSNTNNIHGNCECKQLIQNINMKIRLIRLFMNHLYNMIQNE